MAGDPKQPYTIYDAGFGKDLMRNKTDDSNLVSGTVQNQSPVSEGGFAGGLFDPIEGTTAPASIRAGELPALIGHGKPNFDSTVAGFLMGLDSDNNYKWLIGDATSSIDWSKTALGELTIVGSINGSTITGGTIQTATSGKRVVLSDVTDDLVFYNAAGDAAGSLAGVAGTALAIRSLNTDGNIQLNGKAGITLSFDSVQKLGITTAGITVSALSGNFNPATDNTSSSGAANLKWVAIYSNNFAACPLPTVDNALALLDLIGTPKSKSQLADPKKAHFEEQGKTRKYFDIADMPGEVKFKNSDNEDDIELIRTVGFLMKCVKELNEEIKDLKTKIK